MDGLGQSLFAPNVKGWAGGEAWLNSATLLARHRLAWKVAQGTQGSSGIQTNPPTLVRRYSKARDASEQVDFLLDLLLQPAAGEIGDQVRCSSSNSWHKESPRPNPRNGSFEKRSTHYY